MRGSLGRGPRADPEERCSSLLRAVARFFQNNIGWNRIGVLLSLTIIAVAVVVLVHMLRDINVDEVIKALKATEPRHIAAAAAFVAAGYFTLTFYDLFALRTIGRKEIPYRIAALAGFTSYSIGHNIGATVFTGGAVRYRIYSAYGLDAVEVAKICFVAGLTFWLGNATVLGLGIAYHPDAAGLIDQLPARLNRGIAIAMLTVLASYVGWVWSAPREIGRGEWKVKLPSGPSTLLQIGIGILDLGCCALAMYMLLPAEPNIGFVTLAVVFVSATLLGFASHAPGGLGVFDAAMLVALWQFDKESVLAGLLLFRLLYYLVPFAIALIILGAREIWLNMRGARAKPRAASGDERDRTDPQRDRDRENRRRLIMASEDNSANLPRGADWPSRLRGGLACAARQAGRRRQFRTAGADIPTAPPAHPQALLIESLIGGLPGPAIVLDRDGRVIAFNAAASAIAPALRRGEPALITLRMPELVDAIRRATASRSRSGWNSSSACRSTAGSRPS